MRCDVWWRQWEGALGQWLRGQLDQRGIDAPAYGRYVLSLLTGPLRPDDLSPETVINGKSWDKRNKSKTTPEKIEALKRSAAVQCLLNATDDQSSGIEQLVDELCEKIKEIEEKRGGKRVSQSKPSRRERTRTVSPREMARLYYAAFPALGQGKKSPEPPQPCKQWPSPPRERRNTFHAQRITPKYTRNRKDRSRNKTEKEALPEWVTNEDVWDIEAQDPIKDFIKTITMDEGYATCDNTLICDDHIKTKRLYERDGENTPGADTVESIINKDWSSLDDQLYTTVHMRTPVEKETIEKFEAKFDRSLEALWSKEQNTPDDEYQELPVDFQDLLSSPSDKMFESCPSPGKAMPLSLTASIWSNSSDCNPDECAFKNDACALFGSNLGLDGGQKNVWNNDYSENHTGDTMEALYSKFQPLNLHDPDDNANNLEISSAFEVMQPIVTQSYTPWSTAACDADNYGTPCYDDVVDSVPAATTAICSLTALNHSLQSSFSEVIPRAAAGFIGDSIKRKSEDSCGLEMPKPVEAVVPSVKVEEDLLTSSKTHFCPIKQEPFYADSTVPAPETKPVVVPKQHVESVVNYENGVTFSVDSDWDSLKFTRSSTGSMFLESDINPPTQYMEYRTQGIDYSRLDLSPSLEYFDDGLSASDLVLKFRVCQTEKSVQTDSPNSMKENSLTLRDEFDRCPLSSPESSIFSADREEKQDIALDTDSELESLEVNWIQCDKCKANPNMWVTKDMPWQPNRYNSNKIWSSDENICKTCEELRAEARTKRSETQKSLVHKEETAREWEELLSDITHVRSFQSEKYWSDEASTATPSDDYYLAPKEISVSALDGNFIESASMILGVNPCKYTRKGRVIYDQDSFNEDKDEIFCLKDGANVVGSILDRAVDVSGEGLEREGGRGEGCGGGGTRKRRHSAGGGGTGKVRRPLPLPPAPSPTTLPLPLPLLTCSLLSHLSYNDRPLTR